MTSHNGAQKPIAFISSPIVHEDDSASSDFFAILASRLAIDLQSHHDVVVRIPSSKTNPELSQRQLIRATLNDATKYSAIVICPVEPQRLTPHILSFLRNTDHDTPALFLIDQPLDPTPFREAGVDPPPYVIPDNHRGGELAADSLWTFYQSMRVKADTPHSAVLMGSALSTIRARAFESHLRACAGTKAIDVTVSPDLSYDRDLAKRYVLDQLSEWSWPKLVGIFACNDEMALGARDALLARSRDDDIDHSLRPQIVGFDGLHDVKRLINDPDDRWMLNTVKAQLPEQVAHLTQLIDSVVQDNESIASLSDEQRYVTHEVELHRHLSRQRPATGEEDRVKRQLRGKWGNKVRKMDGLCYSGSWLAEVSRPSELIERMKAVGVRQAIIRMLQVQIDPKDVKGRRSIDSPRKNEVRLIASKKGDALLLEYIKRLTDDELEAFLFCLTSVPLHGSRHVVRRALDDSYRAYAADARVGSKVVGIGELFIHKSDATGRLSAGALDKRIKCAKYVMQWAKEKNLFVVVHLDAYDLSDVEATHYDDHIKEICAFAPDVPLIWAHGGMVSTNPSDRAPDPKIVTSRWASRLVTSPNLCIDLSWSAKRLFSGTSKIDESVIEVIEKYPSRFIVSTDFVVKREHPDDYEQLIEDYYELFERLSVDTANAIVYDNVAKLCGR